jgi:hypothetical protein
MALPTWRAAGAFAASVTAAVPALPAGHALNDILLLKTETSGAAITAPTGYVEVPNSNQVTTTTITRMQCFWKRDNGSETDPTVTAISNHVGAIIHAFQGCETAGDPWDTTIGGSDSVLGTGLSIGAMTTTLADCLIVYIATTDTDIGTARWSSEANAALGSVAERSDDSTALGDGGGIGVWTGTRAVAGSTGTFTATAAASCRRAFMGLALKPPVPAGHPAMRRLGGVRFASRRLGLTRGRQVY